MQIDLDTMQSHFGCTLKGTEAVSLAEDVPGALQVAPPQLVELLAQDLQTKHLILERGLDVSRNSVPDRYLDLLLSAFDGRFVGK